MLQSIYADRLSDEVLAVSASPDVRTEDSDVKSNLDTGESSANREPCDNPTRMSDAPISHKSGFVCRCFAVADGKCFSLSPFCRSIGTPWEKWDHQPPHSTLSLTRLLFVQTSCTVLHV